MKKLLSIIVLLLGVAFLPLASANKTYDVFNIPEMRLNAGITAAQTSGITIAPPRRNGDKIVFTATGGGILLFEESQYSEYIYYPSATVNSTTKVVTLTGTPVRGYCTNSNVFASCENGRAWGKGTRVTLVNDFRLFNFAAKRDRKNVMTGSGQIRSDVTSHPIFIANTATTAQRDFFTAADVENGAIFYNSTLGLMQYRAGGAWISFGSGGAVNATTSVAGKVQLATTGSILSGSLLGSTGASEVLTAVITSMTGGLTSDWGKIPILNTNGLIAQQMLGTGVRDGTRLLQDDGVWIALGNIETDPSIYGDAGSGATTLTGAFLLNETQVNNYTTLVIATGASIGTTGTNGVLIIRTTGNASIYGNIILDGKGGQGGAGTASGSNGVSLIPTVNTGSGGGFAAAGGGGGGGSLFNAGDAGINGGKAGRNISDKDFTWLTMVNNYAVACGGGGGGALNATGGGGDGGGCMIMYVGGDLHLGASTISANGDAGGSADCSGNNGGAGGGGGGMIVIVVKGRIYNGGVTLTANGGAKGSSNGCGTDGGKGGEGRAMIISLTDRTTFISN